MSVTYDCSYHTSMPQGVNIDFFNEKEGPGARVAVELSPKSAMELVHAIMESLYSAGIDPGEAALGLAPAATACSAFGTIATRQPTNKIRSATRGRRMRPIEEIVSELGLDDSLTTHYGKYKAKISLSALGAAL